MLISQHIVSAGPYNFQQSFALNRCIDWCEKVRINVLLTQHHAFKVQDILEIFLGAIVDGLKMRLIMLNVKSTRKMSHDSPTRR